MHTLNSSKRYLQPPFPFWMYKWSLITTRLKLISTPNHGHPPVLELDKLSSVSHQGCHPIQLGTQTTLHLLGKLFFRKTSTNILLDRGYKPKHIKQSIAKARQTTRRDALRIDSNTNNIERVPVVVVSPALGCLNKIIKEYQPILHASQRCREVFSDPTLISFLEGRNLSDLLTSKRLPADPHHHT